MGDGADALHAQQRRAAIFRIIQALLELAVSLARKQRADLAGHRLAERFAQHADEHVHQPLADFEGDIADKPVAHHHVRDAVEDVAPLDVADEVDGQSLQQRQRGAGEIVTLVFLFADRKQAQRAAREL